MARAVDAGRYNLAGPVVLGFVLTVCVLEQVFPAQRRPLLARGHLLDFCYAVFYALLVIPLVVLLGSGFSDLLARLAPWLVLPLVPGVPGWCFVALAAFSAGALIPLLPYLAGLSALAAALGVAAVALLTGGMVVGRLTGRPVLASGLRQLALGAVAVGGDVRGGQPHRRRSRGLTRVPRSLSLAG